MERLFKKLWREFSGLATLNDFALAWLVRRFKMFADSGIQLSGK
jgi:hypothetical protein